MEFNLYITTNHDGIRRMLETFGNDPQVVTDGEHTLHIWKLDWMLVYIAYNRLEEMLAAWPQEYYHLMCYGDAYDEAGEMGELNHFSVTLQRSATYDNSDNRMGQ